MRGFRHVQTLGAAAAALAAGCVFLPPGTSSGEVSARVPLADLVLSEPTEPRRSEGPGERGPDPGWSGASRAADLTFVAADLTISPDLDRIEGIVRSTFVALRPGTVEIPLGARDLEVREVVDQDGKALAWRRADARLVVTLEAPLEAGELGEVAVRYAARPRLGYSARPDAGPLGTYAPEVFAVAGRGALEGWLPTWPTPSDLAVVELRVTVGDQMDVVAGGVLQGVDEPGAESSARARSFRWRTVDPVPLDSIAFAAARFETFTARAGETELFFHLPADASAEAAQRTFGESPAVLRFVEQRLGAAFPFPRYDQVVLRSHEGPEVDGSTLTLVDATGVVSAADELDDRRERPRRAVARGIARKWFGTWISAFEPQHRWLLDGLAYLVELDHEAHVRGAPEVSLEWEFARRLAVQRVRDARGAPGPPDRTRDEVATRAGWALRMIRGRLGDASFWDLVAEFAAGPEPRCVTTEDFRRLAVERTGVDLGPMIAQWGERRELPELEVRLQRRVVEGVGESLGIVVRQTQPGPLFRLELPFAVHFADGAVLRDSIVLDAQETLEIVPVDGPLVDVGIDPEGTLLAGFDVEKDGASWVAQLGLERTPVERLRALEEVEALALRGDVAAQAALVAALLSSPEPSLREAAAAHVTFRGDAANEVLLRAASQDPSPWVRRAAAHGLLNAFAAGRFDPTGAPLDALRTLRAQETSPAVVAELDELLELTGA